MAGVGLLVWTRPGWLIGLPEGPRPGLVEVIFLEWTRPMVVEVGLFEWSRPGMVGMGEKKPGRGVLCDIPSAFQSHQVSAVLQSDMGGGQATGSAE